MLETKQMIHPLDLRQPLETQFEAAEDKELFFHQLTEVLADMEVGVEEGMLLKSIYDHFRAQYQRLLAQYRGMQFDN